MLPTRDNLQHKKVKVDPRCELCLSPVNNQRQLPIYCGIVRLQETFGHWSKEEFGNALMRGKRVSYCLVF